MLLSDMYSAVEDEAFYRRLGEIVRRERKRSRTGTEILAKSLGMSVAGYLRYESGERPIKTAVLARIAGIVGRKAGDLLDEATRTERETARELAIYPLNGDRLRALIGDEIRQPRPDLNLVQFARSAEQAIRLIETLLADQIDSAKRVLANNLGSHFVHVVRFLLSTEERIGKKKRDEAVGRLLGIYQSPGGSTLEDRAARDQAAYFVAASGILPACEVLESAYYSEKDWWVRRSIVRGLAKTVLKPDLATDHEENLKAEQEMQRIDMGFWRFYSGDEPNLIDALSRPAPRTGYGKTVNSLLLNLLAVGVRPDRRFDMRTLASVLRHAAPRSIRSSQRDFVRAVLSEKPREDSAVPAWNDLREIAEQYHDWATRSSYDDSISDRG